MKVRKRKAASVDKGVTVVIGSVAAGFALGWIAWGRDRIGNFSLKVGPGLRDAIEELRAAGIKVESCGLDGGKKHLSKTLK